MHFFFSFFFNSVGISSRNKLLFPFRCDLVSFTWSKWRKNLNRLQKNIFHICSVATDQKEYWSAFDYFKSLCCLWQIQGLGKWLLIFAWLIFRWSFLTLKFMSKLLGTSQNNSQVCAQDYQGLQVWLLHVFALQWLFILKARLPFDRA